MGYATFQLGRTVILLAIALWLFARPLPLRDGFGLRLTTVAIATILVTFASSDAGFSIFPSVTDDLSFWRATASFAAVLGFMVAVQMILWDCSPMTALYCCSSAYLLENLADGLVRLIRLAGIVPANEVSYLNGIVDISDIVLTVVCAAVVYLAARQVIIRFLHGSGLQRVRNLPMLLSSILAILVSIIFDLAIKDISMYEIPSRFPILFSFVHLAMGSFVLFAEFEIIYNHTLQTNLSTMERAIVEQKHQFELSRNTIDAINRRCHDIRHHIVRVLEQSSDDGTLTREQLAEVARGIDIYDNVLRTGNAALDVVITEKGLLARQEGITLSCVADGHALDFMPPADLYTLFAAVLDESLMLVGVLEDAQRSISLNVRDRMGMAAISVEHYLPAAQPTEEALQTGWLALQTVQEVVDRYEGTLSYPEIGAEVMHLDILIPQT